jgi:arylsulfatase A-like enzyme
VWAADAAVETMRNEPNWSGVLVTLPGVDKAAHMWGSIDDDGGDVPMTHLRAAAKVADQQVGKIVGHLRDTGQLDDTLVVLTADHGSVPGRRFHGVDDGTPDRGYYNWYYGALENGEYLKPQPALLPLVRTRNVAMTYSDSMLRAWLKSTSPAKVRQAVRVMRRMPGVSAVWVRHGRHFERATPVRWRSMSRSERAWFARRAQSLLDTTAAPHGADVIATLRDDTTYSVAGDHGGIQRRSQQIPIVFAGGGVGSRDLTGPVRSVDVMPTVLRAMHIPRTHRLDGRAYSLPRR